MIVVNARFLTQKITGVQRYAYEIAVHLRQLRKDVRFISPMNIQHPLYRDNLQAELKGKFRGHVWEQLELPGLIPKRSDILLSMGNTAPVLYPRKIVTISRHVLPEYALGDQTVQHPVQDDDSPDDRVFDEDCHGE